METVSGAQTRSLEVRTCDSPMSECENRVADPVAASEAAPLRLRLPCDSEAMLPSESQPAGEASPPLPLKAGLVHNVRRIKRKKKRPAFVVQGVCTGGRSMLNHKVVRLHIC